MKRGAGLSVKIDAAIGIHDGYRHLQAGEVASSVIATVVNSCDSEAISKPNGPLQFFKKTEGSDNKGKSQGDVLQRLWMKHMRLLTSDAQPNVIPISNDTDVIPEVLQEMDNSYILPSANSSIITIIPGFRKEAEDVAIKMSNIQDFGDFSIVLQGGSFAQADAFGEPVPIITLPTVSNVKYEDGSLSIQNTTRTHVLYEYEANAGAGHNFTELLENKEDLKRIAHNDADNDEEGFNPTEVIGNAEKCSEIHSQHLGFPFLGLKLLALIPSSNIDEDPQWIEVRVAQLTFDTDKSRDKSQMYSEKTSRLTHVMLRVCKDAREFIAEWPSEILRHVDHHEVDSEEDEDDGNLVQTNKELAHSTLSLADLIREADTEKCKSDTSSRDGFSSAEDSDVDYGHLPDLKNTPTRKRTKSVPVPTDEDTDGDDDNSGLDPTFLLEHKRNYCYHMRLRALLRMDSKQYQYLRTLAGASDFAFTGGTATDEASVADFWRIGRMSSNDVHLLRARVEEAEEHWQTHITEPESRPRILIISHDNQLLRDSAMFQSSVVDVDGTLKRENYDMELPLETGYLVHENVPPPGSCIPMLHAVTRRRLLLRTGGNTLNSSLNNMTKFQLNNVFLSNQSSGTADDAGLSQINSTRKCMVLPVINVELDANKYFGKFKRNTRLSKQMRKKKKR